MGHCDKYGEMREIRYDTYIKEVKEASKDCFVVLLLHQEYIEKSLILNQIFMNLAKIKKGERSLAI